MNSFEDMGNAILLANEGQQQIARALARWLAGSVASFRKTMAGAFGRAPRTRDA